MLRLGSLFGDLSRVLGNGAIEEWRGARSSEPGLPGLLSECVAPYSGRTGRAASSVAQLPLLPSSEYFRWPHHWRSLHTSAMYLSTR